jgi:uncharacterized protein GlcG (DUF336 family)
MRKCLRKAWPHLMALAVVFALLNVVPPLFAQAPATQRNLSVAMARTLAEATLDECASKGFHTAVVVVDRSGQMMAMFRDEQASPITFEMARPKAYTAAMFRSSTLDFQKRTADDPNSAPMRSLPAFFLQGRGTRSHR